MLKYPSLLIILGVLLIVPSVLSGTDIFPYEYKVEELENGLRIVSIPLDNPHIISYYTIIRTGSRNEVEPGKSGFAHFFEHMMFKGTKTVPQEAYDDYLTRLGAGTNGYTSDDRTVYYTVFAGRENLEEVVRTESDRFINIYYDEEMLKTEAPVIEGEYYASLSNPARRINELLRHTAFEKHSYKHSTLGYLEDIQDMPNQFAYSQLFRKRFYAPDNTVLLVVGDFDHEELMVHVRKYYSDWERSNYTLVTPEEPPQTQAKRAHFDWPTATLPRLAIGFHGPAFSDEKIDLAALDLLSQLAFSNRSALYQKLVIEEQKCLSFYASFSDHRDPYLLTFNAVVKKEEDLAYVEEEIFKAIEQAKNEPQAEGILTDVRSNLKYSFGNALGTTDGVAGMLASFLSLTGDPATLNKVFRLYDQVTPQIMQEMAQRYFRKTNSTVVTLSGGKAQ
jgi:zinc protease